MFNKFNSTDFWYTFLNSLDNLGLTIKSGISEIDKKMQKNSLPISKKKLMKELPTGKPHSPQACQTIVGVYQRRCCQSYGH